MRHERFLHVPQAAEMRPLSPRVLFEWWYARQSPEPEPGERLDLCRKRFGGRWLRAGFVWLVGQADLQANVEGPCVVWALHGKAPSDLDPIQRMNPLKNFGNSPRLVRLQRPDKVPDDPASLQRPHLVQCFIENVLAELRLATKECRCDGRHGLLLTGCNNTHIVGIPPGLSCSLLDPLSHGTQIGFNICRRHENELRYTGVY